MPYQITADWHKPIYLSDGHQENLIYSCNQLGMVPSEPGVYIFCREHGKSISPLYIGRGLKLRNRLEQQLQSVKLMMSIQKAEKGKRFILYCTIKLKRGQRSMPILQTLESALIAHALAEGHQLFNEQGTKFKQHTIQFTGNRISEALAPRLMLVRAR